MRKGVRGSTRGEGCSVCVARGLGKTSLCVRAARAAGAKQTGGEGRKEGREGGTYCVQSMQRRSRCLICGACVKDAVLRLGDSERVVLRYMQWAVKCGGVCDAKVSCAVLVAGVAQQRAPTRIIAAHHHQQSHRILASPFTKDPPVASPCRRSFPLLANLAPDLRRCARLTIRPNCTRSPPHFSLAKTSQTHPNTASHPIVARPAAQL